MFFIISKIINFLIDPFTFILFSLMVGVLLLKGKRWVRWTLFCGVFLGYMLSTGFIANKAMVFLEDLKTGSELKNRYDVVVVLSGMVDLKNSNADRIEFGGAVDRILAGFEQLKSGRTDSLIISGGSGDLFDQSQSEATYLKTFLQTIGVPPDHIIVEANSRNTYENSVESKKLIEQRGDRSILLITSAFHMLRAEGCFVANGLRVDVLPVDYRGIRNAPYDMLDFFPSSHNLSKVSLVIHEMVGIVTYRIMGKAVY